MAPAEYAAAVILEPRAARLRLLLVPRRQVGYIWTTYNVIPKPRAARLCLLRVPRRQVGYIWTSFNGDWGDYVQAEDNWKFYINRLTYKYM
jgi:hypothetical protein